MLPFLLLRSHHLQFSSLEGTFSALVDCPAFRSADIHIRVKQNFTCILPIFSQQTHFITITLSLRPSSLDFSPISWRLHYLHNPQRQPDFYFNLSPNNTSRCLKKYKMMHRMVAVMAMVTFQSPSLRALILVYLSISITKNPVANLFSQSLWKIELG